MGSAGSACCCSMPCAGGVLHRPAVPTMRRAAATAASVPPASRAGLRFLRLPSFTLSGAGTPVGVALLRASVGCRSVDGKTWGGRAPAPLDGVPEAAAACASGAGDSGTPEVTSGLSRVAADAPDVAVGLA